MSHLAHSIDMQVLHGVMAVDYYELDLARQSHRWVMQELLHLAAVEPGNNMVECSLEGIDFDVPAGWLKGRERVRVKARSGKRQNERASKRERQRGRGREGVRQRKNERAKERERERARARGRENVRYSEKARPLQN